MPAPQSVHLNAALSEWAAAYSNGEFFADVVCPIIPTEHKSDDYFTYSRKDAQTAREDLVGPTAEANEVDYTQSSASFTVQDRALVGYVSNDEINNADDPLQPKQDRTDNLMARLGLKREIRVATLLEAAGNYDNTVAATAVWTNTTTGVPITDVDAALALLCPGMEGESEVVMRVTLEAWQALRRHPQLRGGGAELGVTEMDVAASILGVDRIVVSKATKNTANEGQTASYSRVWDKTKVQIVRVPKGQPSGKANIAFCTMRWNTEGGLVQVREWEEPKRGARGSIAVQASFSDDEIVVQKDMAVMITGALS